MPPNSCQWEQSQLGQEGLPLWRKHPQGRHIPLWALPLLPVTPHPKSSLSTFLLGQPARVLKCSPKRTDSPCSPLPLQCTAQRSLTSTSMSAWLWHICPFLIDTQWVDWAEGQPSPLPEELWSLTGAACSVPHPHQVERIISVFLFHRPREAQWLLSLPQLPSFWEVGVEERGGGGRERKNGPDSGKQEQCQPH